MTKIELGDFSVSLAVRDMATSISFYELLGFEIIDGGHVNAGFPDSEDSKWRILQSGATRLGLFQGMFQNNILTWNPKDVRNIQRHLKSNGIPLMQEADEASTGPAAIMLQDPDGNPILIDQH